ncbi:hypothetical protein [Streptomyces sp. NPDC053367]|uniref:hypothetical protein n=1 Tax=Streptomyces sp. NPDC053367 TaxID=3365700 RepID=UPI0037D84F19
MDVTEILDLPYVDTHTVVADAERDVVWCALGEVLDGSRTGGFRVAGARPPGELTLTGSHRFSSYALIFRLEEAGPARTRLRAETRARFPGAAGALYRTLVIRSGAHAVVVRRLLSSIGRRAAAGNTGRTRP